MKLKKFIKRNRRIHVKKLWLIEFIIISFGFYALSLLIPFFLYMYVIYGMYFIKKITKF